MDPVRLQIENFCRHEKSDISFSDFSSAIIIGKIKGHEKFSNGVGKSTIFSAIKYVLFNEVDASTLDKVIRHGTDSCKVTFDFVSALDKDIYRISRSRGKRTGSEVRLYKKSGDNWDDLTQRRNPDTEKEIAKIVKINYKTFCNSSLFSQSDLSGLASLTPAARKLTLKEALQLNIYSKYESAAKKKAADLMDDVKKEKIILDTIGNPSKDITDFQSELQEIDALFLIKSKSLESIKSLYDKEYEKYAFLNKKFETYEKQTNDFAIKQKSLQDDVRVLLETVKEHERKIFSVGDTGKALSVEIKDLTINLDRMLKLGLRSKDIVVNEVEIATQNLINRKASYSSQLSRLEELKVPLPTGTICKHCRQKIIDRDACQAAINAEILEKEASLVVHKNSLNEADILCKKLNEEIKLIESTEAKILAAQIAISTKTKDLESKRSLYSEYSKLRDGSAKHLSDKSKELDELKKSNISNDGGEYLKLKREIVDLKSKLEEFTTDINDINKTIVYYSNSKAVLNHKIEQRKKDELKIKVCQENISKLEEKYIIHQKVIQAFGSTGIPALITHTILDDFQVETNIWLSKIRPGLQLQFSVVKDRSDGDKEDTLDISYILDGHDMEYAMLSGAQKFIVALALKLGLATVIKKRLGVEMRLLLIDEVDQCLDEGTLEAFDEVIQHLQQDFKVLVITHNNELKAKFNHAILVEQDENFASRAKVVNTW